MRFTLNDAGPAESPHHPAPRHNTYSAWPPPRGLSRYYELEVTCRGEAEADTGYFINIKHIDRAVRDHALPVIRQHLRDSPCDALVPMGSLLRGVLEAISPPLGQTVACVTLALTPRHSLTITSHDMKHVTLRQQYEFSAAHRLHVPGRSDAENREIFGKCNNPAGHGHNYRIEVALRVPIDSDGRTLDVAALDAAVDEHAIQHLDHKHLNVDVPQFAGLNPSVEHITAVVWDMLREPLASICPGAALEELRVWETGKTVCTYRGG